MNTTRPGWTQERRKRFMATLAKKNRHRRAAVEGLVKTPEGYYGLPPDVSGPRGTTALLTNGAGLQPRDRVLAMMRVIDQHRAHWPAVLTVEEVLALAWDLAAVESPAPDAASS